MPARRGSADATWWSRRFLAVLESFAIGSRLQRGRVYARGGQVLELDVGPGYARSRVQGSRRAPYRVEIRVATIADEAWTRVEEALAEQALFAAKLLAGEMPPEIEGAFAALGLSLFPAARRELETDCSCPDSANPCKHIAATYYLLAETFDEDPFLIFAWRGRERDALVAHLRSLRRQAADAGAAADGADALEAADADEAAGDGATAAPPLDDALADFWTLDPSFGGAHVVPHAADTPDALLRQLGPLPAEAGGRAAVERLAVAYRTMTAGAELLAYGDAAEDDASEETETHSDGAGQHARAPATRASASPRTFSTDLRHLLFDDDDDEVDLPPAARRMRDFLAAIVRAATSIDPGTELWSPLRCLRGRGRSPCHGRIRLRLDATTSEIFWVCSGCGDNGVIHGWACTEHDLGGPAAADEPAADPIGLQLPEEDYHLLASLDLVDLEAEQLVRAARHLPSGEIDEGYGDPGAEDDPAALLVGVPDAFRALRAEVGMACRLERRAPRRRHLLRLHAALDPPN